MGWFGKVIYGIIILGLLAILADIITWIYEFVWIIPILILLVILFFVWRKSTWRKKAKMRQIIKSALVDDRISLVERHTILKMAKKAGIDEGEAKIYMDEILHKVRSRKYNAR